jgi:hypothetical protein
MNQHENCSPPCERGGQRENSLWYRPCFRNGDRYAAPNESSTRFIGCTPLGRSPVFGASYSRSRWWWDVNTRQLSIRRNRLRFLLTAGPGFSPNATSATTPDMTFPAFTYTESNSIGHFFSGTDLTTVDVRTTNWPAAQNRDLAFAFGPLPSVIPSQGVALQICSDVDHPCFSGGIQVPSGEEISDPSTAHPFGVDTRQMLTGFMTVSDPPGSISFNFTLEPVLFEVNPGPVPEPTTLLLLVGSGLAGIVGARRRKRL